MKLWPALESMVRPAAVRAEWAYRIGEEVFLINPYLRPWPTLTRSYPRLEEKWDWLAYDVVGHGPDDYVGICRETEDRIRLSRSDLVVYELDVRAWLKDLAVTFGWEPNQAPPPEGHPGYRLIGQCVPCAGYSFPGYFTSALSARTMNSTICEIAASADRPFILCAPTWQRLHPEGQKILSWHDAAFLPLCDAVVAIGPGQWQRTEAAGRMLEEFARKHVPHTPPQKGTTFFPTPAGAQWGNLRIRFTDGHTISVSLAGVSQLLQYGDLGMADRRSKKPTRQWELLREFAKGYGLVKRRNNLVGGRDQKRRERLARDLREFFRMNGEPFEVSQDGTTWRALFEIEPDS